MRCRQAAPLFAHAADGRIDLPAAIESARVWQQPPVHGLIHVALRHLTASDAVVDVTVSQEDGTVAAQLTGRRLHAVTTRDQLQEVATVLRYAPPPATSRRTPRAFPPRKGAATMPTSSRRPSIARPRTSPVSP